MFEWINEQWSYPLMMAILHSFWQGIVIISVIYALMRVGLISGVRCLHQLNLGGLALLFICFVFTFFSYLEIGEELIGAGSLRSLSGKKIFSEEVMPSLPDISMHAIVVFFWICGSLFFLLRFVAGSLSIFQIRRISTESDPEWQYRLTALKKKIGSSSKVVLRCSTTTTVPMVIGIIRPVIVFPLVYFTQMTTEELESILIHELIHVKRKDFLINTVQHLIESFLFFNPATWWISQQICRYREYCCDDEVQRNLESKKSYLNALYKVACHSNEYSNASIALINNKSELTMRVKRMLHHSKEELYHRPLLSAVSLSLFVFVFFSFQSQSAVVEEQQNGQSYSQVIEVGNPLVSPNNRSTTLTQNAISSIIRPAASTRKMGQINLKNQTQSSSGQGNKEEILLSPKSKAKILTKWNTKEIVRSNAQSISSFQTPLFKESYRIDRSILTRDTTPTNLRIRELEKILDQKSDELDELADQLSEEMEERVELEVEKMEALSEQLERILEPQLEALENEMNNEEMKRLEELSEQLEEKMEAKMEIWENKMESEHIAKIEASMDDLSDRLEELYENEHTEENQKAIEKTHRELEVVQKNLEKEMAGFHKAHDDLMKDPEFSKIQKEMEMLSEKLHANHEKHMSHSEIWTDEAKALQSEITKLQQEIELKMSGMTEGLHEKLRAKTLEVEKLAKELHEERKKLKHKE